MRYHQGIYRLKNPSKYKGDPTNVCFRSSWERKLFLYLDTNKNVLEWSSEEVIIWYVSPVDSRKHRYFPDVKAVVRKPDNTVKTILIEVKPKKETREPKVPPTKNKQFLYEVATYGTNMAKWEAARQYCSHLGWEFKIITEDDLFPRGKKKK